MAALALIVACAAPAFAKTTAVAAEATPQAKIIDAHPALWVVKDRDTTIYLFGTIHLLRPNIRWFEGPVRKAFDKAQDVVLEIADRDEAAAGGQAALVQRAFAPDAPPLSSRLPAADGARYLAALQQNDIPAAVFDKVKPWFATFTLSILPLQKSGYDPASGADRAIEGAAQKAGKRLIGLETTAQQLGFFETMPEALQLQMLSETIDELPTITETIGRMIAAWSSGNPDGLADLMNESIDSNPEFERILLTDRNAHWADWIKARLDEPGTVFIAVGAGHLAGEHSVQAMLKARGVTSRRVDKQR
ncbi:TraB/GumN family protein [Sphingobium sp. H33]|uniref:TraB/GumN family protein n=1 Tax=Sphingobium nicotianae TaxID=2782607 RepID=A0A9X1D8J5_9SPHN|nr:TraB/GumN family protein [Sphingobium nicotianae]